jgi:DNA-3-methyladenine glycosylase II
MRGVKPPRYPTLWEACVNAVVFQQVSLHAATAILRKLILAVGAPSLTCAGSTFHSFPSVASVQLTADNVLLAAGLSGRKLATLRRLGDALLSGALDESMLEDRASPDAVELLCHIKGIGPWTATVILLRGLGRLDVFPMNDSSVTRNLALVAQGAPFDIEQILRALGVQKGMLYYHLLLARLEVRDDLGRTSVYQWQISVVQLRRNCEHVWSDNLKLSKMHWQCACVSIRHALRKLREHNGKLK